MLIDILIFEQLERAFNVPLHQLEIVRSEEAIAYGFWHRFDDRLGARVLDLVDLLNGGRYPRLGEGVIRENREANGLQQRREVLWAEELGLDVGGQQPAVSEDKSAVHMAISRLAVAILRKGCDASARKVRRQVAK